MSTKRLTTLLVASVFCSVFPASITLSQSNDLPCNKQEMFADGSERCDDAMMSRKTTVDPSITNSIDSDVSNSTNANNSNDANGSGDNTASSSDDGSGDHDNGHGNDPDHDDSSNPGQGGGNHGADK